MVLNLSSLRWCSWHSHMACLAAYKSMTLTPKWALVLLGGPTIDASLVHLVFHTLDYFTEFFLLFWNLQYPVFTPTFLFHWERETVRGGHRITSVARICPCSCCLLASVWGPSSTYTLDLTASSAKAKAMFSHFCPLVHRSSHFVSPSLLTHSQQHWFLLILLL